MNRLLVVALLLPPTAVAAQMGAGPIPDNPAATRGSASDVTMNAVPDNPAATRGNATSGVTMTPVPNIPEPIPGDEADIPGAPETRRTDGARPAAVVAPRVVPVPVADGDEPTGERDDGPVTATFVPREEGPDRVALPGRIPPVNLPDTRTRFREVGDRRALVAAREALRDALAAEDPAQIAEARRRLQQARAALREESDDPDRAAWLATLRARRAEFRRLRASPEWEVHVVFERRARLTRLLAEGAEEADVFTPAVREELRVHARRMARLARVREVAEASGDQPIIDRVDGAVDREVARHAAALRRLGLSDDLEEGL